MLKEEPDRYIYDAVKKGVELPLPPEIEKGVDTSKPNLIERRKGWNKAASSEYALPTEIWREVVARRRRYEEVHAKLANGEVHDINDLITYNLDIRRFAQDVIENCEGPEMLRAMYHAIENVTILDPTCGSGVFLFAALNILEPLKDIQALHTKIGKDHGEYSANRALALLNCMLNKAIDWGFYNGLNPAKGVTRYHEKSRERFLRPEEMLQFFSSIYIRKAYQQIQENTKCRECLCSGKYPRE